MSRLKKSRSVLGIHSRLQSESMSNAARVQMNEYKKIGTEMKQCTFKPQFTSNKYSKNTKRRSKKQLIHDLTKQAKKREFKQEAYQILKQKEEMDGCTFKPEIKKKSNTRNENSQSRTRHPS